MTGDDDRDAFDAHPWHLFDVESTPEGATISDSGYYTCTDCDATLDPTRERDDQTGMTGWSCPDCGVLYWLGRTRLTDDARDAFGTLRQLLDADRDADRARDD